MEARDISKARPRPFQLSLRVRHPSIDPAEISRELHLSPEHSFKAGEPRRSGSGLAATALHAESYWIAALNPALWPSTFASFDILVPGRPRLSRAKEQMQTSVADSLTNSLALCVTSLLHNHTEFLRRVACEGGDVRLIVEVAPSATQGFSLTPQMTKAFGDLGITLEFEFAND